MSNPVLSPPPSHVGDVNSYSWKKWFNELFDRVGSGPFSVPGYTVAGLPSATNNGSTSNDLFSSIVFVSDESGGATLAFSDGTNWRRVTDNNIVS